MSLCPSLKSTEPISHEVKLPKPCANMNLSSLQLDYLGCFVIVTVSEHRLTAMKILTCLCAKVNSHCLQLFPKSNLPSSFPGWPFHKHKTSTCQRTEAHTPLPGSRLPCSVMTAVCTSWHGLRLFGIKWLEYDPVRISEKNHNGCSLWWSLLSKNGSMVSRSLWIKSITREIPSRKKRSALLRLEEAKAHLQSDMLWLSGYTTHAWNTASQRAQKLPSQQAQVASRLWSQNC